MQPLPLKEIITTSNSTDRYAIVEPVVDFSRIDTVLISHVHKDHIGCLDSFIKKYDPNVYLSKIMYSELDSNSLIKSYDNIVYFDTDFYIDNLKIELIKTSHDTKDSRGFIITENDKSVV